jgi:hypothetical protein
MACLSQQNRTLDLLLLSQSQQVDQGIIKADKGQPLTIHITIYSKAPEKAPYPTSQI